MPFNLVAICGPNASGKTRLGVAVARAVDGEVISVDSRQVYRGMDIGTGKDLTEYGKGSDRVPVHLIDIVDPSETYTLWQFQRDFYRVFGEIRARGRMPVAVGGTGLYLEAVLRGYRLASGPADEALRAELAPLDREALDRRLLELDPSLYARTDRSTKRRLVRAIETALRGREQQAQPEEPLPAIVPLVIAVKWPREELRRRIRERLERRLAGGLVEEVARLRAQGVTDERLEQIGLEYRYVARHLAGTLDRDAMREQLYTAICQFAKRQDTWFRGMERRGVPLHWVPGDHPEEALGLVASLRATP